MDVNTYLGRQYDSPPCWQLVTDVYRTELGLPVTAYKTVTTSIRDIAAAFRVALHKSPEGFQQTAEPADLCVVLMGRRPKLGITHCGIYWHGSVLHALDSGVYLQDLASIRDEFPRVEFWSRA